MNPLARMSQILRRFFVNSRKIVSLFLLSFLILGHGVYAEAPQVAQELASNPAQGVGTSAVPTTGQWSDGWYQGAEGYNQALQEYKKTQKSMVVYISVGWCPYCRKFEKGVLSSTLVMDFMKDMIKVNLNPEAGRAESQIASQYGVRGFPSFFLHPPQPGRAIQLYTGVTPEEFIKFFDPAYQ